MAFSSEQRYYLKRKALYYFYEKDYSNTDIAKMLGISRVTLNRLLAEAKAEGMVKIEIIDTKNLERILKLEDEIKTRFNLEYVGIVNTDATGEDLKSKLAIDGARHFEQLLRSNMSIGIGWGGTLSLLINSLTPNSAITGLNVYTLMGGACSEANFQPNLLAQSLVNYYSGNTFIINAPFVCHSELLCSEIQKEPSISNILESAKTLDLALIGIGQYPTPEHLKKSYYNFSDDIILELQAAGAVGDICGNFIDKDGNICKTSISSRTVSVSLEQLRANKHVMTVAGGETKSQAIRSALKGGFIDILITDYKTATEIIKLES